MFIKRVALLWKLWPASFVQSPLTAFSAPVRIPMHSGATLKFSSPPLRSRSFSLGSLKLGINVGLRFNQTSGLLEDVLALVLASKSRKA